MAHGPFASLTGTAPGRRLMEVKARRDAERVAEHSRVKAGLAVRLWACGTRRPPASAITGEMES